MVQKNAHLFNSLLLLLLLFAAQSCKQKPVIKTAIKPDVTEINKLLDIGHQFFLNEQLDSSYYYYTKARALAEAKKDTSRILHSIAWLAELEYTNGDFISGEATAIEALPYIENTPKFPNGKRNIYNTLGNINLYTKNYKNALTYFDKAYRLKITSSEKDEIKNNIALVYLEENKIQKATALLQPLSKKEHIKADSEKNARQLDNLGYLYFKANNPLAISYLKTALKIRLNDKNERGLVGSFFHLAEFYKQKNLNLSVQYANAAYQKATILNTVDDRIECLSFLIKHSQPTQSKKFAQLYLKINDSIIKVRSLAKNQFAKIRYDSTKEKEENARLKAQNVLQQQQQRNKNVLLYCIVGTIITVSIFVGKFLVTKNKREKAKSAYNTELRISKKLHDELANDVFQTMAFAETQDLTTGKNREQLLNNLETIYQRTRNISKENSFIDEGPLFLPGLKEMISGFNDSEVNVLLNGVDTINWLVVDKNVKITVYRVIQELLVNMKKHSYCSIVVLTFRKNENKLQIDYSDNGVGTSLDENKSRNGLQNVENRIIAIKGTITFVTDINKGFKATILLPF